MRLAGRRVLLTAAGQGIGRASAIALAREGAEVIATDVAPAMLVTLAEEQPGIAIRTLDVRDASAICRLAEETGPLDGLFNCAGVVHNGDILSATDEDWDTAFDINAKAQFRMIRAFLPGLLARAAETGDAVILNMASCASSVKGFPNRVVYGASKAAVVGLTKAVAADHVRQGLRCNALCPGTVDTPSLRGRIAAAADPVQAEKDFVARQLMGRLGTAADIAPLVVYLMSGESRYVTGQAVLIDGGTMI